MNIYDPIVTALGISPMHFTFDLQQHIHHSNDIIPIPFVGQHHTDDAKLLLSTAAKKQWAEGNGSIDPVKMRYAVEQKYGVTNVRELKTNCPHCGKYGQMVAMKRWHFDNCKSQSPSSI